MSMYLARSSSEAVFAGWIVELARWLTENNRLEVTMTSGYKYLLPLAICGALVMTACSSANKDWADASTENTISGYQAFLDRHASDEHAQDARTRIAALQDHAAWTTAQTGNSL